MGPAFGPRSRYAWQVWGSRRSGFATGYSAGKADVEAGSGPADLPRRVGAVTIVGTRLVQSLRDPGTVLPMLLIAAFVARAAWLDVPQHTLIFDESYYVNAARTLLGWPVEEGAPYAGAPAGLDPNLEHPPLGKLLLALSMLLLGDNGLGWRLPSLIAGMAALGAVYLIVRSAGESAWFAILAVGLLAFDNLTLVHGRLGTLDMLALAPILVGAWLALRERWALAGAVMGLGLLVKLSAGFGLLAVLLLLAFRLLDTWRGERHVGVNDLRRGAALVLAFSVVSIAGLWLLDARYTSFATPVDHARHMIEYASSLKEPTHRAEACSGISSVPWQWPFNECQINYLRVAVTVQAGDTGTSSIPSIDFRGALNPLLAGAIPIASLFALWAAWRSKNQLARWTIAWAAANYLPYVALSIVNQRVTYIYYFLPVIPAVAIAVAILLLRSGLPRFVTWGFIVAFAAGFVAYFPFRQIP
jgi:dolichyl-phosphate-mannose-protein mannosyltransferase